MRSSKARICCPRKWRPHWRNSWRSASSTRTASRGCARCCCRRIGVAGPVRRRRRRGRVALFGMQDAGRWTLVRRGSRLVRRWGAQPEARLPVEHVARVLLERWGVVFWKVYQREAQWLPPWRELLMVYRRLEARGEIRGGRFVAGFSGEQYATPAAISALRESRRRNAGARMGVDQCRRSIECRWPADTRAACARAHRKSHPVSRRSAESRH